MFSKAILSVGLLAALLSAPQLMAKVQTNTFIESHATAIFDELVDIRRDLNRHPEASGQEKRTSAIVARYLRNLGLEVETHVGGYGVVGILKGAKQGKSIAWRADMDAAKFEFAHDGASGLDKPKVGHICGHDVHTTIGLGIANVLSQKSDSLAGTVYFLFQPAEETATGAQAMLDDGLFERIKLDEIYGLHVSPSETGTIATKAGNLFSHQRRIKLSFDGTNDAQELSETVNTILKSTMRVKSHEKFMQLHNIIDPNIGLANPETIFKDYIAFYQMPQPRVLENSVVFQTQVYTSDKNDLDRTIKIMETMIAETNFEDRLLSLEHAEGLVGVDNDPKLANEAIETLIKYYGMDAVERNYGQVPLFSEDFGMFQKEVPGVFFFLGAANAKLGAAAFPHMPNFSVDEKSIQVGVSYMSTLLLNRMNH